MARTEGRSESELVASLSPAGENECRNVQACDEEQETGSDHERSHQTGGVGGGVSSKGAHGDSQVRDRIRRHFFLQHRTDHRAGQLSRQVSGDLRPVKRAGRRQPKVAQCSPEAGTSRGCTRIRAGSVSCR